MELTLTHMHILCLFNNKPIVKLQTPSTSHREIYQGKALPRLGFGISSSLEVYPTPPLKKHNNCEIIVMMDFAVNYSFVVSDAAQSYHWNNAHATIHPMVVYFRSADQLSNAHIGPIFKHDHLSLHAMICDIVPRLEAALPTPKAAPLLH